MELFELFQKLSALHGPSGHEEAVAAFIGDYARPFVDEVSTDALGSLILHKKGRGPKLLLSAPMDRVGVVVTYLEEDGTARCGRLGAIRPQDARHALVRFENGTLGAIKAHGAAKEEALEWDDLYLDIGAGSREEAQRLIRPGDTAVFCAQSVQNGFQVISPCLSGNMASTALLRALERLSECPGDLWLLFSAQGAVGARGAKAAAYRIAPDHAVTVDVTAAYDWPGAPKRGSAALGKGAAIKVMDASVLCHPAMVERLRKLACKGNIPYQMDVQTKGGSDAGAIHKNRVGVVTGGVSIPCRYLHTPTESADLRDVEACVALLTALAEAPLA